MNIQKHHISFKNMHQWSNRGKFRNRFYNEFLEQYGEDAVLNIKRVATKLEKYI